MPQVSIYFDENLTKIVSSMAKKENVSVSKLVSTILYQHINDQWPESFIKSLGALADSDISRPEQPSFSDDAKRERI